MRNQQWWRSERPSQCAYALRQTITTTEYGFGIGKLLILLLFLSAFAIEGHARLANSLELPTPVESSYQTRHIESHDLVTLRDIGGGTGAISVSPDGQQVAFHLQQGDIEKNTYQTGWFVIKTTAGGHSVPVGIGGDVILVGEDSGRINGSRVALTARWSPDSEWIAYRLKRNNEVQLWRSRRDGSVQEQLTNNAADVVDFEWSYDGNILFFQVGVSRAARRLALQLEGEKGYLYDDRFLPINSTAPIFTDVDQWDPFQRKSKTDLWVYNIKEADERPATADERKAYRTLSAPLRPLNLSEGRDVRQVVKAPTGLWMAWFENEDPVTYAGYHPPLRLYAQSDSGEIIRCSLPECYGQLENLIWSRYGSEIYFIRKDGVNQLNRVIYAWGPGTGSLRTVLETADQVSDCTLGNNRLICLHESAITPRKIIAIRPSDGLVTTLLDPNPQIRSIEFTRVEKLEWHEASGADAAGHLVYPRNYQKGQRYPLVIVQYRSRGFLRGGVGDEFPIHPLAAAGFFVLSFDRPEKHEVNERIGDPWEYERHYWGETIWEKSSALSALEVVIDQLVDRELIDPKRVGITGLSDGSETLWYAMIHSNRFAAAATSHGGWSPSMYYLVNRAMREKYLKGAANLLPPGGEGDHRWRRISPELNADQINTPILIQVSDHELIESSATIGALKDAGKPIEAYVFPNEYHIKWQPRHKLAVYERVMNWFRFWLLDHECPDFEGNTEYKRWRQLSTIHDKMSKD